MSVANLAVEPLTTVDESR